MKECHIKDITVIISGKVENRILLPDSQNISNRWKNYLSTKYIWEQ
jgi:hypothetical protein